MRTICAAIGAKPLIEDKAPADDDEVITYVKPVKEKEPVQPLPTQKHGDAPPTPIEWLVYNRLEKIGPGLMPGQWGAYKTFIALDLSAHIMVGWDWTGSPVYRQGGVLIFAPEGARSISMRLQAVINHKIRPARWQRRIVRSGLSAEAREPRPSAD